MQEWAESFYKSHIWRKTQRAYMSSVGGICEECKKAGIYRPAEIVHHKIKLTPENIGDSFITLDFMNLEALCRECHGKAHSPNKAARPYRINADGSIDIPPGCQN